MLLNTFAPPFKLIGGYFLVGLVFLLLSVFWFVFADFNAPASLQTASFFHIFLTGFVMSIIIAALYQLTSVILEKEFFTIKFSLLNLVIYFISASALSYGMLSGNLVFMHAGGGVLFLSFLYFCTTYLLSFLNAKVRTYAFYALLLAGIYLLVGIVLGFCLLLIVSGSLSLDFELFLKLHVYFVLGFIYLIILGASSVLIPMFALSHKVKFTLYKIALIVYVLILVMLFINLNLAYMLFAISFLAFISQVALILKNRVRKAWEYWNLNIVFAFFALLIGAVFFAFGKVGEALFLLCFGFLYAFIVAHMYKIVPFLIWYHYIAPFVGKTKVPMLEDMILKKLAYIALWLNVAGVLVYVFGLKIVGLGLVGMSVLLVLVNMINIFKYIKFGVKNEQS
ncbi:peptidase M50 [Campylobacter geochelonis]|uniref:peptidase M50 n=1 Tax=Campylobacter geochelonis TaxID=1780362 RepID=UPI0007707CBB|nr:peptidase M50 [Campylobacter geochelonis]CZE50790.1 peptidase M50 [Campylobacter geochelonis]